MESLTITTIQTNLFWENKTANLQMLKEKINSINQKKEIVVLPEMFSTGYTMQSKLLAETMDGETVNWMKEIATENKIILTGSIIIKEENNFFNRLIWMLPNGEFGYYNKRHLFALANENLHYTAGSKRLIAQVKGWKINLQICYDLRFPIWSRQQLKDEAAEYDVLIYVASWPAERSLAWATLLQARAIENQCYVIGVNRVGKDGNGNNYTGNSLIIDPLGEIVHDMQDLEAIFTIDLKKEKLKKIRTDFPFWKDADAFNLL